jgi:MYXO-CTERM domain-containing protein
MPNRPVIALVAALQVAAILVVPAVQAQDPAAPHLSPDHNILYAHHHDSDTEELNGWMNTLVTDPTGNDIALGPPASSVGGVASAPYTGTRTYTLTLAPGLQGPVTFDPAGNIVIDAYIGSGSGAGVVRVTTELRHGSTVIVTGAAQNHQYDAAGTGPYDKVTWTLAPAVTELAPGEDLVWEVELTGVAQAVFLSVSPDRGSSAVTLPVLTGGGPAPGNDTGNSTTNSTTSSQSATSTTSATSTSASASVTTTTSSTSSTTAADESETTTTNSTGGDSQDSPAPPLALAALAVLAAAFVVRRRLR